MKCFQSERSSRQSLQFLRPTHQNFNFISVSGRFGHISCLFFMARIQFHHKSSALTAIFRVRKKMMNSYKLNSGNAMSGAISERFSTFDKQINYREFNIFLYN